MTREDIKVSRWWLLLLCGVIGLFLSGCASLEPENASARPWNQPQGWETGLPPAMYEGR
jgi:hypothetical protein